MLTDTPILHRLGDLEPGTPVSVDLYGNTACGVIDEIQERFGEIRVKTAARSGLILSPDLMVHRLIPETPLAKHAGEMLAAFSELAEWCGYGMGAIETYDRKADAFYRETGEMAPGKSRPMDSHHTDLDELRGLWDDWLSKRQSAIRERCENILSRIDAASEGGA